LSVQTNATVSDLVSESQLGTSYGGAVPRYRMAGVLGALIA
jgi:hypothetical protein